jgi:hypothetical protein
MVAAAVLVDQQATILLLTFGMVLNLILLLVLVDLEELLL